MKKNLIITGAILGFIYIIFLLLPLIVSPILNSHIDEFEKIIKDSSGINAKLGKISLITTPKLTVGIKLKNIEVYIQQNQKILSTENLKVKLSLLPLLIRKIELDCISLENISADLKIRPDGHFLFEEYLIPQQTEQDAPQTLTTLPLGLKLSNRLPDIKIANYDINLIDMQTSKNYELKGEKIKVTDFILDKKLKLALDGNFTLNSTKQFEYNIKLFNKLMPQLNLHEMVFNPQVEENPETNDMQINILDILKKVEKSALTAKLDAKVKTYGTFEKPFMNGYVNLDGLSLKVDGKMLPESYIKVIAKTNKYEINSNFYTAENELTSLNGVFKNGKNLFVDMKFNSKSELNNIFKIINALAQAFDINDFQTLSAKGKIDADFNIKSNMKNIKSNGYIKLNDAMIKYGLYNIVIEKINTDIQLNNNLDIKNMSLEIFKQPLKISGIIESNSDTNININADRLLIKGIIATLGQVQLLKENNFNSGSITLNANLSGKLKNIVPKLELTLNNIDIKNIPSNTQITMPNAKLNVNSDGKIYNGILTIDNLKCLNPLAKISLPTAEINIGNKDITINKAYVLLNNSRIDITGKITDYISEKLNMDLKINGNILATDLKSMLPKELNATAIGKLPLTGTVRGDLKAQDINVSITANSSNYVSVSDIDVLKGNSTIINSTIHIADDCAKLTNTGVYINNLTNPLVTVLGSINNLSKSQNLNLRLTIPKTINLSIPGFKKSNLATRGDIEITGTAANPYAKGLLSIPSVTIDDMALTVTNMVINLNGALFRGNATVQSIKSGLLKVDNIATEFNLKDYDLLYLNNLNGDAYDGKISGNVSYKISNGGITANITGEQLNAVTAIEGASGIKNALSGLASFNANIKTKGATDVDIIKNLTGKANFKVENGKFMNMGRFDNLLYAQNLLGNAVLKAVVTSITNIPVIQNSAEFKEINGNMVFSNGWAQINKITSTGPLMAYYINGRYNILNGTTNVVILGRIDEKIVAVLGPLGDLSVDKLTSFIPKFGSLTSSIIKNLTSDPAKENVSNIPALSSSNNKYKDFKVEFNGGIESRSSIKSFKWLSKCDTTAIDYKQEAQNAVNNLKNTVTNAKQDIQNTRDAVKNTILDSKQQFNNTKEELKNMFKMIKK